MILEMEDVLNAVYLHRIGIQTAKCQITYLESTLENFPKTITIRTGKWDVIGPIDYPSYTNEIKRLEDEITNRAVRITWLHNHLKIVKHPTNTGDLT